MIITMTSYMWDAWANVCTSLFKLADTSNTLAQIHANKQTSMSAQRVFFSFICGQQTSNNAKSFFHDIDLFDNHRHQQHAQLICHTHAHRKYWQIEWHKAMDEKDTKRIFEKKNKNKNDRKKYYKQIDETKKLTAGGSMILSLYYILRTNEWSLCQRVFVCRFEI